MKFLPTVGNGIGLITILTQKLSMPIHHTVTQLIFSITMPSFIGQLKIKTETA